MPVCAARAPDIGEYNGGDIVKQEMGDHGPFRLEPSRKQLQAAYKVDGHSTAVLSSTFSCPTV